MVLSALFGQMVVLAVFSFPGQFRYEHRAEPARLSSWVVLVLAEAVVLSILVIIVGAWRLLGLVSVGQVFTAAALRWLKVMLIPAALMTAALGMAAVVVAVVADDPGPTMLFLVFTLISFVLTLITVLAREVIKQGIALTPGGPA